jgi:hypothetical protein
MLLQDRILALIAARPGVRLAKIIRVAIPDAKRGSVISAVRRLLASGKIERVAWGCYQLAPKTTEPPPPCTPAPIFRPPLARLMAGR